MIWEKQGLIYAPDGSQPWAASHAMMPTPLVMSDTCIRLYTASVDVGMVGRIGYIDVDARDPTNILRSSPRPVFDIGQPGAFDDHGVVPSCVLRRGAEIWMYYVGFQIGSEVRYFMFSGLAISRDGGETFNRVQSVPVLDRIDGETLFRTAPWLMAHDQGWRMWYVGGNEFVQAQNQTLPSYLIRDTTSVDGVLWHGKGEPLFGTASSEEIGFGRPYIIKCGDKYRMWYSVRRRSDGYRMGYAESPDGTAWTRRDDAAGIGVSDSGWDSQMICYGAVVETVHDTYIFYNGNDFGRTGVGVAIQTGGC